MTLLLTCFTTSVNREKFSKEFMISVTHFNSSPIQLDVHFVNCFGAMPPCDWQAAPTARPLGSALSSKYGHVCHNVKLKALRVVSISSLALSQKENSPNPNPQFVFPLDGSFFFSQPKCEQTNTLCVLRHFHSEAPPPRHAGRPLGGHYLCCLTVA